MMVMQFLQEDTSSAKRIIFTFHLMGCMCQLLMFTYSCDCLMHDSMSMANAVYSSLWSYLPMDKYGKLLRKDLMFVIMRSRSPCCLTACGFFPVSLETYTGVNNVIFIFIKIFLKLSKLKIYTGKSKNIKLIDL